MSAFHIRHLLGDPTIVDVQHQGIGALDKDVDAAGLGLVHVADGIDDKLRQEFPVLAEAGDLLLDVVVEQVAEALLVAGSQLAQLGLEALLVEDLMDTDAVARRLVGIRGTDAAARGADLVAGELALLQAVDAGVELEVDLGPVADEDVLARMCKTLFLEGGEFFEEGLDVEDHAGADQVGAVGVDEARWQQVEAGCESGMSVFASTLIVVTT